MRLNDIFSKDIFNEDGFDDEDQRDLETLRMVLNKRCKDIYKFYQNSGNLGLIHSVRNMAKVKSNFIHIQNREGRVPTDTPLVAHELVDQKLDDMFGVKFRSNALFTYPMNVEKAMNDNAATLVFPYDGFVMASAEDVSDLYLEITRVVKALVTKIFSDRVSKALFDQYPLPDWYQRNFFNDFDAFYEWLTYHPHDLTDGLGMDLGELKHQFNALNDKAMTAIYDMITRKYYLVDSGSDIVKANGQEIMVHSDQYIAINPKFLKRALDEEGSRLTMSNIIQLLYGQ